MKAISIFFTLIIIITAPQARAQNFFIVQGTITDVLTGKPVQGVLVQSGANSCITNLYGRYMMSVGYGEHTFTTTANGYKEFSTTLKIFTPQRLDILLMRVSDLAQQRKKTQMLHLDTSGTKMGYFFDNKKMYHFPVLFSESDVLKNIQYVPGVSKSKSGIVYTSIRGMNTNQTNFFVDGVPIYHIQHASGYISTFSELDYDRTELIKNGMPAQMGGRAGGAVVLSPSQGDSKKLSGAYQLSLPVFAVNLNGPLGKKLTFNATYRRSYVDWILKSISTDSFKFNYHFTDINIRLRYAIDKNNYLYFQSVNNLDHMYLYVRNREGLGNGKTAQSLRNNNLYYGGNTSWLKWERLKENGYSFLTLISTKTYTNNIIDIDEESISGTAVTKLSHSNRNFLRQMKTYGVQYEEHLQEGKYHWIFGGNLWLENFETGSLKRFETSDVLVLYDTTYRYEPIIKQTTAAIFLSEQHRYDQGRRAVEWGGRVNFALNSDKTYVVLEPRISYYQKLDNHWNFKASFDRTGQMKNYYQHQTNFVAPMLSDHWLPLTKALGPQVNDQVSFQFTKLLNKMYTFEGNAYYVYMESVTLANPGARLSNNINSPDFDWHKLLVQGKGKSYGTEIILHKNSGLTKGWVSWCQTWSYRKIEGYNNGEFFRYSLDRKCDITIAATHQWRRRLILGTTLVVSGGLPISVPSAKYILPQGTGSYPNWQSQQVLVYSRKNNSTFGAFKRIDFSMNLIGKHPNGRKQQVFTLTVYNMLAFFNPEALQYRYDKQTKTYSLLATQSFPFLPSVSYQYRF